MPSTLSKVCELSESLRPKHVVSKLLQSVGGIIGASSASQLPRNRQQSADCLRQLFSSKSPASHSRDPLFKLMLMCKESEGSKSSSHTLFVRIVTNSVYDWTLRDMESFCAEPQNFTTLSVDPTFNLGSFHMTVTTYRHPIPSRDRFLDEKTLLCLEHSLFISAKRSPPTISSFPILLASVLA